MSPGQYLRTLRAPDESRWKPMLLWFALCAAAAGGAVQAQASVLASLVLTVLTLAAWVVSACAMIGYFRWYVRSELQQAQQDKARDKGETR
jgi:membrane protein implicated in regulation of membrane protease activity